jgi:hypothetical protein
MGGGLQLGFLASASIRQSSYFFHPLGMFGKERKAKPKRINADHNA